MIFIIFINFAIQRFSKMDKSNKTVNALWIGEYLSSTELLTINSFLNKGHSFVLWSYNELKTELPKAVILKDANEIFPKSKVFSYKYSNQFGHGKGSYAGFSDIFRYKLLYLHGGWWTDMDVTCLKALDFETDYVFRTHHDLKLVGNIMKCPKNSLLMKKCFEEAVEKVTENNRDWHLPIQILVDNVKELGLTSYIRSFSNPDSWNVIRKFLAKEVEIPQNWYIIHWVNEEWRRNKIDKTTFLKNSLYAKLANENTVNINKAHFFKALIIKFKLS